MRVEGSVSGVVEVTESDWLGVDAVALRILPAIIQRDGASASSVSDQVGEAYAYAEEYVQWRTMRQKEEYEREQAEACTPPTGEQGQKNNDDDDHERVVMESDDPKADEVEKSGENDIPF